MAQRPAPVAMMNHRGERIMPLPYRPIQIKSKSKSRLTRKLSSLEGDPLLSEHFHLNKKQRSERNVLDPEPEPPTFAMKRQVSTNERATPFDLHLQAVYEGTADDGLEFFESHGYYDITDANTVEMFRQNFGLSEAFWLGKEEDEEDEDTVYETSGPAVYPFGSQLEISSRSLLHRDRTDSGRFTLLDDDGNEVDEDSLWEMEREDRLKARSLELDELDLADLEHDEEQARTAHIPAPVLRQAQRTELPPPMPPADLNLPPYCGYVNVLKDTIPFLLRSWRKRWFYLDFQAGVVLMYKRSYWKSPRGVVDLRNVAHVEKMSHGDFRLDFHDTGSDAPSMMLLRTKVAEEAELWVNLLRFAKQASTGAPRLTNGTLVESSTKALKRKVNKKNQVDILAQMLANSARNAPSRNLRAIAEASASAASAVSNLQNRHNALTA
ncbi:hypothetical protein BBO99_00006942 [Phytophthora kernoviae]|uniref:PH domain-containing protein n=2 Tax=Phytophthora kernoviae TaxID=325452 RepID=A0A3R7HU74_9STRA|nr:hypothetical protein G195_010294 [Phytophthora kernoviae 00238/432]KAG2509889.1 hypothetical protein JM16_008582 [Phytophthora kernoviae]KAG2511758.1 hypothetical protein JM18_008611 [Phytophthora kernoviae]RLN77205.1 hypothetical protein BBO99_00006942 [Phytophthora kernoviae]